MEKQPLKPSEAFSLASSCLLTLIILPFLMIHDVLRAVEEQLSK
jgi:hypothetical protein